jgi:hypothetical protein
MRTDYLLRTPHHDELRHIFGSLDFAYRVTGGDIPTLCFYLANPKRIPPHIADKHLPCACGSYAAELRKAAQEDAIVAAFNGCVAKTLVGTSDLCGYSTSTVRRVLVAKGLWPKPVSATTQKDEES